MNTSTGFIIQKYNMITFHLNYHENRILSMLLIQTFRMKQNDIFQFQITTFHRKTNMACRKCHNSILWNFSLSLNGKVSFLMVWSLFNIIFGIKFIYPQQCIMSKITDKTTPHFFFFSLFELQWKPKFF